MERYCMRCGSKINEGDKFCQNCGASNFEEKNVVNEVEKEISTQNNEVQSNNYTNTQSTQTQSQGQKTNGLAIAGFVCSLVGLLVATFVMGIIAICLSISAKRKIAVFNQGGKGLATAGLVIGIVDVSLGAIMLLAKMLF